MTSPDIPTQNKNEGFFRLYCKANTDGDFTLTVKINTRQTDITSISDYDMNMDEWKVQ